MSAAAPDPGAGSPDPAVEMPPPGPGERVLLVGLGTHGGGAGATRWLCETGASVRVTDLRSADDLAPSLDALADLDFETRLGEHDEADLAWAERVVASPAVPDDAAYLVEARRRGLPVHRPMTLFCRLTPARIVGVTGSVGKTTTTTLLGEMLDGTAPSVRVGGNIGRSLLPELPAMTGKDRVVLELSSYQLEDLDRARWSPPLAVWTSLVPNHLDRHGTLEAYARAKATILRHQGPGDVAVLPADDPLLVEHARPRGRVLRFASAPGPRTDAWIEGAHLVCRWEGVVHEVIRTDELGVPGDHHLRNAAAATLAALAGGADLGNVRRALRAFEGVPGRVEPVGRVGGVRWWCDTSATTPHAAAAGIRAMEPGCTVIAGGSDKGIPFDALAEAACGVVDHLVLVGRTADAIEEAVRREAEASGGGPTIHRAETLEEAVRTARDRTSRGADVILAPACASFDMFRNAEHRGEVFRRAVGRLAEGGAD